MTWSTVNTAQLISDGSLEIGDGYRAKNSEFAQEGGLPFVRVKDVGPGINTEHLDQLPLELISKYQPKVSRPGDSLITMKGTVGRVAYVTESTRRFVYSPQISYWRPHDTDVLHPRWISYWLQGPEFGYQASATKGSTDMADYINLRDQRRMKMSLPPIAVQRRIADILGAIDDLIENNRRRIEVLEEMAQAIYREWFVSFRYPGHEDASFVDSPLGRIPEGWEYVTLGDVVELSYGKALKKENRVGGDVAVIGSSGIVGWHDSALVDGPSIVVGRKGNVGNVIWISTPSWPIDTTYFVRTDLPLRYVAEQLKRSDFINSHAAVPGLSREQAYSVGFLRPSPEAMYAFQSIADIVGSQAEVLRTSADRLASVRDLLLPKLVTGQIDVSNLGLDELVAAAS